MTDSDDLAPRGDPNPGIARLLVPGLFLPLVIALLAWVVVMLVAGGAPDVARLALHLGLALGVSLGLAGAAWALRRSHSNAAGPLWAATLLWLIALVPLSFMIAVPAKEGHLISGLERVIKVLARGNNRKKTAALDEAQLALIRAQLEGTTEEATPPPAQPDASSAAPTREDLLKGMLGVVTLPGVLPATAAEGGNQTDGAGEIFAHEDPDDGAPTLGKLLPDKIDRGEDGSCAWSAEPGPGACLYVQIDRVTRAAPVYEIGEEGWFQVALDPRAEKRGWIKPGGKYTPLGVLLGAGRPTYFAATWDRMVYAEPGGEGAPIQVPAGEVGYRAQLSRFLGGRLWLKLEVVPDACDEESEALAEGWVPAHAPDGRVWAWFKLDCE